MGTNEKALLVASAMIALVVGIQVFRAVLTAIQKRAKLPLQRERRLAYREAREKLYRVLERVYNHYGLDKPQPRMHDWGSHTRSRRRRPNKVEDRTFDWKWSEIPYLEREWELQFQEGRLQKTIPNRSFWRQFESNDNKLALLHATKEDQADVERHIQEAYDRWKAWREVESELKYGYDFDAYQAEDPGKRKTDLPAKRRERAHPAVRWLSVLAIGMAVAVFVWMDSRVH